MPIKKRTTSTGKAIKKTAAKPASRSEKPAAKSAVKKSQSKSSASKKTEKAVKSSAVKSSAVKKPPASTAATKAKKPVAKKVAVKTEVAKTIEKKTAGKAVKKTTVSKAPAKKTPAPKVALKASRQKTTVKSASAKKAPAKKTGVPKKNVKTTSKPARPAAPSSVSQSSEGKRSVQPSKRSAVTSTTSRLVQKGKRVSADNSTIASEKPVVKTRSKTAASGPMGVTPYEFRQDETYMNEFQRAHFMNILNLWKQQLMQEVDLTVGHMKEGDNYADLVDRASMEADFNLELRTRDRERKLIRKIEQAMDSIDAGDYGYCEDCDAEIGVRRLEARPTATKCIDCKTFQEIREKQGA